ncbi:hypothetical protein MKK64_11945, partial [Methylobacterium sp. E-025]|nr:hypothetical protein [Methylobacterium sp. E-025]
GAVDLSGFNGSVGSSLVVTGSDGTTRSVTGTTIVADTVAPLAKASLVHVAGDGIIDATEAQSATMPVTGTLSAALGAGDQVVVSLNGVDTLASVSGTSFTAAVATPIGAGTVTVSVVDAAGNAGAATSAAYTVAIPVPSPAILDTLVFRVSGDSYQGDPHFQVLVDGHQIGGTLTTSASHAAGQTQDITLTGQFGTGAH